MSEKSTLAIAGETVTIRPIRLTDVAMESDFIHRLSSETKRFRFLAAVNELPAEELVRLCNVDKKHTMAFVATVRENGREVEIGVSRYAPNSHSDVRGRGYRRGRMASSGIGCFADESTHSNREDARNQAAVLRQPLERCGNVGACHGAGYEFNSRSRRPTSDHPFAYFVE